MDPPTRNDRDQLANATQALLDAAIDCVAAAVKRAAHDKLRGITSAGDGVLTPLDPAPVDPVDADLRIPGASSRRSRWTASFIAVGVAALAAVIILRR